MATPLRHVDIVLLLEAAPPDPHPRNMVVSCLSSHLTLVEAPRMTVQFYQNMIDRGWRRSGDYLYQRVYFMS